MRTRYEVSFHPTVEVHVPAAAEGTGTVAGDVDSAEQAARGRVSAAAQLETLRPGDPDLSAGYRYDTALSLHVELHASDEDHALELAAIRAEEYLRTFTPDEDGVTVDGTIDGLDAHITTVNTSTSASLDAARPPAYGPGVCGMCANARKVVAHVDDPHRRWDPYDVPRHGPDVDHDAQWLIEPCPTCWPGGQK